jgi:hypothetical protein
VLPEQGLMCIIFDALDEYPNSVCTLSPWEKILDFIEWLVELQYTDLQSCVTSRPEVDIKAAIQSLATDTVSSHDEDGQPEDVKNYINLVHRIDAHGNGERRITSW